MLTLTLANIALGATILMVGVASGRTEEHGKRAPGRSGVARTNESELGRFRSDVIRKLAESRAVAERLVTLRKTERQRLLEEYQLQAELFRRGLVARNELLNAEKALAEVTLQVAEDERRLAETEMAINEASLRDELLRLPELVVGAYVETSRFLRFNGGSSWTLEELGTLERFFAETFGRPLPISARGQTTTHERLRFDHRDAVDIPLHPDSTEGRSLLQFLRNAGIPFLAFRNAVPGSSTGAHIHIGKPSPRL